MVAAGARAIGVDGDGAPRRSVGDEGPPIGMVRERAGDRRMVRGLAVLSRDDCLRILERGGVGRLAVPGEPVPTIRPVNFAFRNRRVVMRTADPALCAAAEAGVAASFEFDEIRNEDHRAWSVIVTGTLELLDEQADDDGPPVGMWVPRPDARVIALTASTLRGRQVPHPYDRLAPMRSPRAVNDGVVARRSGDPDGDGIDRWGRSDRARSVARVLLEPVYRYWFRFRFEHLERIPMRGGALLVANHAGVVPVDAALVMHGIERELDRPVYGLHHHALSAVPVMGTLLARAGGVVAHPDNALRLLRDDRQLLLVFPEGTKGTTKPYRDRYRLARFGRGGFVETAMRAGVPVVPIAIFGTEETMPTLGRLPGGWPVTLNALVFGAVGAGVHFPVSVTARVLEPVALDAPPGLEHYPTYRVADATEMIRSRIQVNLDDMRLSRSRSGTR